MNADDNSSTSNCDGETIVSSCADELSSVGYSWTDDWDYTCWDEPERRPKSPISPPIPEYQGLKLEMLSKPEYMMSETKDGDTWGIGLKRKKKKKTTSPKKRLVLEEEEEEKPESPKSSPWKKVEVVERKDPWAFLEPPKPTPPPPRPVPPPREDRRRHQSSYNKKNYPSNASSPKSHSPPNRKFQMEKKSVPLPPPLVQDHTSTPGRDPSKLCKYKDECRMNKNGRCTMVHSLKEWKPRLCNFNTRCNRKTTCGYYHQDQHIRDFLVQMIKRKDTIYQKNSVFYEKYLKA